MVPFFLFIFMYTWMKLIQGSSLYAFLSGTPLMRNIPNSKVHGANMGPTRVLSAASGPHVGLMNLAILDVCIPLWIKLKDYRVMKCAAADISPNSLKSYQIELFLNLEYPKHVMRYKCVNDLLDRNYNPLKIQWWCKYFVNEICFNVSFEMNTNSCSFRGPSRCFNPSMDK